MEEKMCYLILFEKIVTILLYQVHWIPFCFIGRPTTTSTFFVEIVQKLNY